MGAPVGNQNAKKAKEFERRLRAACEQDDWERIRLGFEEIQDLCATGDLWALQFVRDTLDGKPAQNITATDDEGRSLAIALVTYDPTQLPAKALPAPDTEVPGLRH